jgi:glycosidase
VRRRFIVSGRLSLIAWLATLLVACGGGGGGSPPVVQPPPPPPTSTVTVYYLRADPRYDGWGLHLWGNAIDASTGTTWDAPRMPDRIANDMAVFEVPVTNTAGEFNFIAHNGDLKSPVYDMSIVPGTFGDEAWLVQDSVASASGNIGTPYATEAAARAALNALGNASSALDLSPVTVDASDSGLPADWADSAAFIEIYVRGYQDSDGDGTGDLQGLVSRLDYLQGLGIRGIWLMPVFESADNDHGYAVQDYRAIESDYGTMADFETLLDEAHARGIAVIVDYVMNHAASTNPLFLDATTGSANDKYDWFVWEDPKPAGWNTFAGDPWRNNGNGWYYGVFSSLMPDFNLENAEVVGFHLDNLRFWLNKGVDGFRFDAVGVLFENDAAAWNNQPENHALLEQVQALVTSYGKRFMVCEAPDDPAAFAASSSCGRAFAFGTQWAILDSARGNSTDGGLTDFLAVADADRMPLFLSNHDSFAGDRPWNQLNGDVGQYELAAATCILASRNPFTYYGEEVGMANASSLSGDHALRTPMSWTPDTVTAGFTTGTPFRDLSANVATHNVMDEEGVTDSLLERYRALFELRISHSFIASGSLTLQSGPGDPVLRRHSRSAQIPVSRTRPSTPHSVQADSSTPTALRC